MHNVVCNSGPLIHLAQINLLKVFEIFPEIVIPQSVFDEVTVSGKLGEVEIKFLKNLKTVGISKDDARDITKLKSKLKKWKLSQPELEAIYLSRKLERVFLTDDLDAREAAESIGIEVHGSVGIVIRAFKEKMLSLEETINALNDLYEKSRLFISRIVINEAIRAVRKHKLNR